MANYDFRLNPNKNFYPSRRSPITCIVIHTAENLPDFRGADGGAEAVARYGAKTSRKVSWHATVDSDSTLTNLPDDHTAWHVKGFNSISLGVEIATKADSWQQAPSDWVDGVLDNLSTLVAHWCRKHDIAPVKLTKREVKAGQRGIVSHATLDPKRRRDPGLDFPWDRFLQQVHSKLGIPSEVKGVPKDDHQEDVVAKLPVLRRKAGRDAHVEVAQTLLGLHGQPLRVDGMFGPITERAVRHVQAQSRSEVDGIIGSETWSVLLRVK